MTTMTAAEPIVSVDQWSVHDVMFTKEKVAAVWELLQRHTTLFSDLTRGDYNNFVKTVVSPNMLWYEIRDHDILVGLGWFTGLHQVVDYEVHLVFFDKQPAEKLYICKAMIQWMFHTFPIHRITSTPPVMYRATIRLLMKLGFEREGTKRESVIIGGRWNDQAIMGITRGDMEAMK